jgi:ADP-heptose:LPS heptosyltransferase
MAERSFSRISLRLQIHSANRGRSLKEPVHRWQASEDATVHDHPETDPLNRRISYDCRYFLGDRPCVWHKKGGHSCECAHYEAVSGDILIIKLDAVGDVLRTTCLLPLIARCWPARRLTWMTRGEAAPLLENSPFVDGVLVYGPDALVQLSARCFERVINLDAGRVSAGLAAIAKAPEKIGYVLDERGVVKPTNDAAEDWLRLGIFDDLKRENRRSYQEIMCRILGLPMDGMKYVLELSPEERSWAGRCLENLGVHLQRRLVGIHTGGGGRWRWKQWHPERFLELAESLRNRLGSEIQIVLFGGPLERDINERIANRLAGCVFDAGCDNGLRQFASLVSHCSVVLSGDTLAMHVALAVGSRVVVLFGPTSSAEIELFDRGEKIIPDIDCLVCYKQECDFKPNCMDLISVSMVENAVVRQLREMEI